MNANPPSSTGRRLCPATFLLGTVIVLASAATVHARPNIKSAFMSVYPNAVGSKLDDLPSMTNHCAVCHYQASGGGAKNPYGEAILNSGQNLNKAQGRINAVTAVANLDSDGDGYPTATEVTAAGFSNTPTFPGLINEPNNSNVALVTGVPTLEIIPYVKPTTTVDTTPPEVTVLTPNGGESLTGNAPYQITWSATDASGIAGIHIYQSIDGGTSYTPVVLGIANTGTHQWFPANRPTDDALIRVVAVDAATNSGSDVSDAAFAIVSPPGGKVPTTLRDFDMPGSQPFEGGPEPAAPSACGQCHGNYDAAVEPYRNWQGSMMAHASLDPLFEANMVIANQDAPDSGDLCLRCHDSGGWLQGRSVPTDGSAMLPVDKVGVSCDLCHRMTDPVYKPGISPTRDQQVLGDLENPGTQYGNGMFVLDPSGIQRGPFTDALTPHQFVASPFHRSAEFCGTCHDVSNPAFTKDVDGVYQTNPFNTTGGDVSAHSAGPVERTFSEWKHSAYNSPEGIYQPEFAGNKADGRVSTCQDCHMHDVSGKGCTSPAAPTRPDLPLHDMTGGSTWLPPILATLYPDQIDAAAVQAGVVRATAMLRNAADLTVAVEDGRLLVRVTNQTGHKLPTGYPEGRRMWVNVKFLDAAGALIGESAAYDAETAELSHDAEAKIYEVHPGIGSNISSTVGLPAAPSLHFVLNNKIYSDNRIPPRGFTNEAFATFGGAPVGHSYADGQHWDDTPYTIPAGTKRAEVSLFYQSTSREFVEFLRDENRTNSKGQEMYDLWAANGKCPPTLMAEAGWQAPSLDFAGLAEGSAGIESAALAWPAATGGVQPVTYRIYQATISGGQEFGAPVLSTTELSASVAPLDAGTTTPQTYYFVVRAADAAGASETNTVEIAVTPLPDPAKDQDGDGMANGLESQYGFNPFDPADALADNDGDGLQNLAETALGSDPTDAADTHLPTSEWVGTGAEARFALRYIRRQNNPCANVIAEVSTSLGGWESGPAHTTIQSVTDNLDGTETVVESTNTPVDSILRSFMRLRIVSK
ncbi:MAG: cytochrome c family protein [Akkermansiaceae bacterium]|nr:cytochrome c family protein [Akkermansiaceae bacterium]MCF7733409.1 cytochrome c family protein [Akkermansiaceae bacterium]